MPVDKNLFLHDLAVVAIMKNEGPYLKEWLDYHLLAGVDHFYIYDNESPDNQAEVAKPYIAAGLVDYFPLPGKIMQMIAYNDAIRRFKFQCRYMAFIDADEFIYPKNNRAVVEVVDKILSDVPQAASLSIHWQCFGSNGQEKADHSRGVLERFTRRAPKDWAPPDGTGNGLGNVIVKAIVNPRMVKLFYNPHFAVLFEDLNSINENKETVIQSVHKPIAAEKIVVNHYQTKSFDEYMEKRQRGAADGNISEYQISRFNNYDRNEKFDDGILKYRAARKKTYRPPDKSHADERLLNVLTANLSPTLVPNTSPDFYVKKLETFLTCRAVAAYLKTKLTNDAPAIFFEEASLKAAIKSITNLNFAEAQLLLSELPNLLTLPYPVVNELRDACLNIVPQMKEFLHLRGRWGEFAEINYIHRLLQTWK